MQRTTYAGVIEKNTRIVIIQMVGTLALYSENKRLLLVIQRPNLVNTALLAKDVQRYVEQFAKAIQISLVILAYNLATCVCK